MSLVRVSLLGLVELVSVGDPVVAQATNGARPDDNHEWE